MCCSKLHRVRKKVLHILCLLLALPNADRFSKFFTDGLNSKLLVKGYLKIPPQLKRVATLPCEIFVHIPLYAQLDDAI